MVINDGAGIVTLQDFTNTFPHGLIGLPVAAGGKRITMFPVILVFFRIPVTTAYALDQFRADTIAFNRQGMIGVLDVNIFDVFEIGLDVLGPAGCFGKALDDLFFLHTND